MRLPNLGCWGEEGQGKRRYQSDTEETGHLDSDITTNHEPRGRKQIKKMG